MDKKMLPPSLCDACKRLTGNGRCTAFPAGIPARILANLADHREPYEGDHGLMFVEDPERNQNLQFTLQILENR